MMTTLRGLLSPPIRLHHNNYQHRHHQHRHHHHHKNHRQGHHDDHLAQAPVPSNKAAPCRNCRNQGRSEGSLATYCIMMMMKVTMMAMMNCYLLSSIWVKNPSSLTSVFIKTQVIMILEYCCLMSKYIPHKK